MLMSDWYFPCNSYCNLHVQMPTFYHYRLFHCENAKNGH